jgi:tungstate transport system substrate-binding protein
VELVIVAILAVGCRDRPETPPPPTQQIIRCAVVGGMVENQFWPELVARFEARTGHIVKLVAAGPKALVVEAFRKGDVDLLTTHASDAIINLVAEGRATDPEPWVHNDLLIVGPPADPAGIRNERDAVVAVRKIIESDGGKLLVHASMGADEVLHGLLEAAKLTLPEDRAVFFAGDRPQEMMSRAAETGAYALAGRIPFRSGKIPTRGLEIMVQGDPRLRRPYVVVVRAGSYDEDPRVRAAHDLAAFLREAETQRWIGEWGKGKLDAEPVFYPMPRMNVVSPTSPGSRAR